VLGNILTCLLTLPEPFVSIGASTAVFGALGILSGLGLSSMRRSGPHLPLARTTAPLIAGIVLLGWLGVGRPGDNTDVLGHVMGFCSGLAAGLICERMIPVVDAGKDPAAQARIK
jgi:rhomboid protease GluP